MNERKVVTITCPYCKKLVASESRSGVMVDPCMHLLLIESYALLGPPEEEELYDEDGEPIEDYESWPDYEEPFTWERPELKNWSEAANCLREIFFSDGPTLPRPPEQIPCEKVLIRDGDGALFTLHPRPLFAWCRVIEAQEQVRLQQHWLDEACRQIRLQERLAKERADVEAAVETSEPLPWVSEAHWAMVGPMFTAPTKEERRAAKVRYFQWLAHQNHPATKLNWKSGFTRESLLGYLVNNVCIENSEKLRAASVRLLHDLFPTKDTRRALIAYDMGYRDLACEYVRKFYNRETRKLRAVAIQEHDGCQSDRIDCQSDRN